MNYHITNFFATSEEDVYQNGCNPETSHSYTYEQSFDAANQTQMLEMLMKHFGVDKASILLNACEEPGRVDISRLEDIEGNLASKSEIDQWKAGNKNLYLATYTGYLKTISDATWTIKE